MDNRTKYIMGELNPATLSPCILMKKPLLDKIGIEYSPEDKYKGLDKKDILRPGLPTNLKCF